MIEKIKEWIFIGFVFLATVICILAINTYNNAVIHIEFSDLSYKERIAKVEMDLETLETNECTEIIKEWIVYYRNKQYGNISINKLGEEIFNDKTPMTLKNVKKCLGEDYEGLSNAIWGDLVFARSAFFDSMSNEYLYQYRLSLKYTEDNFDFPANFIYASYRTAEMDLIEKILYLEKQREMSKNAQE